MLCTGSATVGMHDRGGHPPRDETADRAGGRLIPRKEAPSAVLARERKKM